MAKVIIPKGGFHSERKTWATQWVAEDPETRAKTEDISQAAVWLRQGFDVVLYTNAFEGFEVEFVSIRDVPEVKEKAKPVAATKKKEENSGTN